MTPILGQSFSSDLKSAYAIRNIDVKNVFRRFCSTTTPPKIKILILICVSGDNLGCVLINSRINPAALASPELTSLHIPIKADDHTFLSHDSFIDCSSVYELQSYLLQSDLTSSPEVLVGQIDDPLFVVIVNKLKNAITITPKIKKKYSLA